ncbi:MAG: single-stranded-DNA-specific exonuclease RecJ [Deltaproteobacteria bacterium]|nr:single-stranded-DNA-specific exonuclease RecJ [Deltaproteobacteria bacterium]
MKMNWEFKQTDQNTVPELTRQLGFNPVISRLLNNRSIYTLDAVQRFLRPSFKHLRPPFHLKGVEKATARIISALRKKEKILVFGDYDVDGITATFLMYRFLRSAGAQISYYIPHRITEGYGLKPDHISPYAVSKNINLIITVDCGSASHDAVFEAQKHGIDIIVTDHHEPPAELPEALAVINPKQRDCSAGLEDLAGVGVAFYLIISLRLRLRKIGFWQDRQEPNLKALCDLVALGTVADMVPMLNENRILTRAGLDVLQTGGNTGIRMLMQQCGLERHPIDSEDISFKLAPRLNAAGRIEHADAAMALLAADSPAQAAPLAEHLHQLNLKRRTMEKNILAGIDAQLTRHPLEAMKKIILLCSPDWHVGILGIVASRLVNRYACPVVILALEGDVAKGSARSVPGINLAHLFSVCSEHLISHGGHAMAAGLQIRTENIESFRNALEKKVDSITDREKAKPVLLIDGELSFKDISRTLIDEMELLKPFGEKNPAPLFVANNVRVHASKLLSGGHRRMSLGQTDGPVLQAIHFNPKAHAATLNLFKKIAYRLQLNRWNGQENIQLVIEDILI